MGLRKRKEPSRGRLPRVPHADRPRPGERILKRTGADLQNGWLARHGTLYLTEDRLVFIPTLVDTALRAKRREIILDDVQEIERFPIRAGMMPPGGRRPRMLIHTGPCVYEFLVGDLDAWIDTLERVYQMRAQAGRPHRPPVKREDHVNIMLAEE